MKKVGQPGDVRELTAGRATLMRQLWGGTADREGMSMAANWIRDIWADMQVVDPPYNAHPYSALMDGTATDHATQKSVAKWLAMFTNISLLEQGIMTENEARAENGLPPLPKTPNDRQPGGDHYRKRKIQHWDFVSHYGYSYIGGQISKYVCRWPDKGGALDIEKAVHFLEKQLELDSIGENRSARLDEFLDEQRVGELERQILTLNHAYEVTRDPAFLRLALKLLGALYAQATA